MFTLLTERQILVLKAIVEEFIHTAQPVGSRVLSKKEELNFSAATIRNEMADLEDLGFLEKTHTSSGRIPSQKGYRYYVDYLVKEEPMETTPEVGIFKQLLNQKQFERETTIKEAVKLLSSLTNYTSILLGPSRDYSRVKKIQFVPISDAQAVFVLITDQGHVERLTIPIPDNIDIKKMETIIKALDELLVGEFVGEIHDKLTESFENQLHDFEELVLSNSLRFGTVNYCRKERLEEFCNSKETILIIDEIQESSMVYNSIRALQGELNCHVAVKENLNFIF